MDAINRKRLCLKTLESGIGVVKQVGAGGVRSAWEAESENFLPGVRTWGPIGCLSGAKAVFQGESAGRQHRWWPRFDLTGSRPHASVLEWW